MIVVNSLITIFANDNLKEEKRIGHGWYYLTELIQTFKK